MSQKVKFIDKEGSLFYATLRSRVDQYFKERNISKNANGFMYFKAFFYIGGTLLFYSLIMSNQFSPLVMLLLAIIQGAFMAMIGFNVSHDGLHGAYSQHGWVNKLMGDYSFYFIGASPFVWKISHNIVHHTYTNIPEHDEDIVIAPGLIRLSPEDKMTNIQKFQHWYGIPLYGLASINWVLKKDYLKFFQKTIGTYELPKKTAKDYFNLFFFKALYYAMFIVIPFIVLDITWWQFIIGFVCMHFAMGLVLGLVFQLAHVVEGAEFPYPNNDGNIEEAWAIHQMRTTANFGRKNWLTTFICGGLNLQVEHHLFPLVCHVHYPAISDIVKQTAQEFGVPYLENKSFLTALKSHYEMLKLFGIKAQEELSKTRSKIQIA